jgi:hypothetical protein
MGEQDAPIARHYFPLHKGNEHDTVTFTALLLKAVLF